VISFIFLISLLRFFLFFTADDDIQPTQMIQEQDEIIRILTHENERLQELLETQVISQHRENDAIKERLDGVNFFSSLFFFFLTCSQNLYFLLFFYYLLQSFWIAKLNWRKGPSRLRPGPKRQRPHLHSSGSHSRKETNPSR